MSTSASDSSSQSEREISFDYSQIYYKVINRDFCHNSFQYKHGLNIDTKPFSTDLRNKSGLYFTNRECICRFLNYGYYVCEVKILPDTIVINCHEKDEMKWKASQIWLDLDNRIPFCNFPWTYEENMKDVRLQKYLTFDPLLWYENKEKMSTLYRQLSLQYVPSPPEDLCILILQQKKRKDENQLQYIEWQTKNICKVAVENNGMALQFVKDIFNTHEIMLIAVTSDGMALQFVPDEYRKKHICETAIISSKGMALPFVKDQEIYKQLIPKALQMSEGHAITFIQNTLLTPELCMEAVKLKWYNLQHIPTRFLSNEMFLLAIKQNGLAIKFINHTHQTSELAYLAVSKSFLAFEYINQNCLTPEICMEVVKQNGSFLRYIPEKFHSFPLYLHAAADSIDEVIRYMKNITNEFAIQLCSEVGLRYINLLKEYHFIDIIPLVGNTFWIAAIQRRPSDFIFIPKKNHFPLLCSLAVELRPYNINEIENQTIDLCWKAVNNFGTSTDFIKNPYFFKEWYIQKEKEREEREKEKKEKEEKKKLEEEKEKLEKEKLEKE